MTEVNNVDDIIREIFPEYSRKQDHEIDSNHQHVLPNDLTDVRDYLDSVLANIATSCPKSLTDYADYRLGPASANFNLASCTGIIQSARSDYCGIGNFNTVRADVCVFRGKWQYEVLLETRGVMQFGWCTIRCDFSQESGVGDTLTSFSYDGGRVRKWNVHNLTYGESWLAGDIISCLIDCDDGTISFKRNGTDLGVAFDNVPCGKGIAYFPAISISHNERVQVNFGAIPLRHPTENYLPIDDKPRLLIEQSIFLFNVLEQIVHLGNQTRLNGSNKTANNFKYSKYRSISNTKKDAILMIVAQQVVDRLLPLLNSAYVIHHCLVPMLLKLNYESTQDEMTEISLCLDYFWAFLENDELVSFITRLLLSLNILYYFEPVQVTLEQQRRYLHLLHAIMKHEDTRKLALDSIYFRHVKLPLFIDIKQPDNEILKQVIPEVWSKKKFNFDDLERNLSYLPTCQKLKDDIALLENLQIEILKILLNPHDVLQQSTSSKSLFISKFRHFLRENLNESPIHNYQPGVIRNFFHRLLQVLEFYWIKYDEIKSIDEGPEYSLPFDAAYVPSDKFIDNHFDYFNLQRLGGVQSHLEKEYSADLKRVRSSRTTASSSVTERTFLDPSSRHSESWSFGQIRERLRHPFSAALKTASPIGSDSLTELLDGLIILYHIGVHKNYVKIAEVTETLREYNESLIDINNKLSSCRENCAEIRDELLRSKKIFEQQTEDLTRKIAWISMNIFSHEKRRDIVNIHRCVHRTLQNASETGNLFGFVPEIYLNEVYLNTFTALNIYYPLEDSTITREFSTDFVQFIANHMQDTRIVNADVRDNMIQALSAYSYYSGSLRALENMKEHHRLVLIRTLLTPNPSRSWAMTNLILVRFWKGYGFGFRYSHVYPSKFIQSLKKDRVQDPSPSLKYQQEIGRYLSTNVDEAIDFLNCLLGHLNWAFSEFMGTLKDLILNKSRPNQSVDLRQMKLCSTCFDVTVSLLRTIEMTICVAPNLILNKQSSKSEIVLTRLLQLISQIIARLATKNYVLEEIERMKIFILDNVQPYPIFSAVCGILVHLINRTNSETSTRVCRMAHREADLDLSGLCRLIYGGDNENSSSTSTNHFKLISQPEINRAEIIDLEESYRKLNDMYKKLAKTKNDIADDDESICIICYSHQIQGEFRPCKHQACLSCIHMHFMTSNECFFCKTRIDQVVDPTTGLIIDSVKPNENNTKDK